VHNEDVTTEILVDDGPSATRGRLTVLTLTWQRCDPLAVTMTLISRPDHPALPRGRWVLLRDFLRYGLDEPTGDGNVRITPDGAGGRVWMALNRGDRQSGVRVDAEALRIFLDRTEQIVPAGEERAEQELDKVIETLLRT
jgi:Streptomyces sporulation and cell division protein, SsgA